MRNDFEIKGDVVEMKVKRKGLEYVALFDTDDFEKVSSFERTWFLNKDGYVCINFRKDEKVSIQYLHRLVMEDKLEEGTHVDHEFHNRLDNRKKMLRVLPVDENTFNRKGAQVNSSSGVRGVYYHKLQKKWRASFTYKGERYALGGFDTLEEAEKEIIDARERVKRGELI